MLDTDELAMDVDATTAHPLDPLTADEIRAAVATVKREQHLGARVRFALVTLFEPDKDVVRGFEPGAPIERRAFVVCYDRDQGRTYEAVVALGEDSVESWEHIPGAQPSIMIEEFFAASDVVKADADWQEAMRRRGITDFDLVQVDPWSAGNFDADLDREGRRLIRAMSYSRTSKTDNGYARPIENVVAFVDLNAMQVVRVEDHGVVPVPSEAGNYDVGAVGEMRQDLRTLDITQPEGPSFEVHGNEVHWQKWRFRFALHPNEGLVLYRIGYEDDGRVRPVLYRASLSDMVVPYGDPSPTHFWKNAFDAGEYGLGKLVNPLELGCDCLGEIRYFDAVMADDDGEPYTAANAICMHEEDYGILWKHFDFRTETAETRRSRRLVISCIATVGNYEYGFYWYLYQDGNIELDVKLTGIIQTGAVAEGETPTHGTLVAPGLYGPNHQHFFNVRLDFEVDGPDNSVYEVDILPDEAGPDNPAGNAFRAHETLLATEQAAQRRINAETGRYWKVVNPGVRNRLGQPVAYKLYPGYTTSLLASSDSVIAKRAGFTQQHLFVTPYSPDEMHAAGDYPNQHPGGDGLPQWTAADRSVEDTDVVVWHTFAATHIVRPEDWPVMPVEYCGFKLKPQGFFDRNPSLDVPPSANGHCAT